MPSKAASSSPRTAFMCSVMELRLAAGYLPLATPGWFETRTTGRPRSFSLRMARAAPGSSLNSSTERGESGPSRPRTIWLMTPSRSTNTAFVTLDLRPKGVHHEVVKKHVDALHDRRAEFVDEDGDG